MRTCLTTLAAITLCIQAVSGACAIWEGLDGSDSRPRHCTPVTNPTWTPPGLHFLDTRPPRGGIVPGINLLSVLDGADVPEIDGDRFLLTMDFTDAGQYRVHNESFGLALHLELGRSWLFLGVDRFPDLLPWITVPDWGSAGTAVFSPAGELVAEYHGEPTVPVMAPPYLGWFLPAVGDFTENGRAELVYGNDDAWRAFDQDGELVARHFVVDPYDSGWRAYAAEEEGRPYIYLVTLPRPDAVEEFKIRLYKLSLRPALPVLLGPAAAGPAAPEIPTLPYVFKPLWMREFPSAVGDEALIFHDLTGDGAREIIIQHTEATALKAAATVVSADGELLYQSPLETTGSTAVGDVNGDGIDEVVLLSVKRSSTEGRYWEPYARIIGIQWDGSKFKEIYDLMADDEFGGRWLSLCDLDGDGRDEIIIALGEPSTVRDMRGSNIGDGKVKVINGDGETLWEYRLLMGQPSIRPVVTDFTGNGQYEIIVGNNAGQVFVFSPATERSFRDYEWVLDELKAVGRLDDAMYDEMLEKAHGVWIWEAPDAAPTGERSPAGTALVLVAVLVLGLALWRRRGPA